MYLVTHVACVTPTLCSLAAAHFTSLADPVFFSLFSFFRSSFPRCRSLLVVVVVVVVVVVAEVVDIVVARPSYYCCCQRLFRGLFPLPSLPLFFPVCFIVKMGQIGMIFV